MVWTAPQADLEAHLRRDPGVVAACTQIADEVAGAYRLIALSEAYDSGVLVSSVHVAVVNGKVRVRASALHAAPNEGGTGIFGPRKAPIVAKPGRPFVFTTRLPPRDGQGRIQAQVLGGVPRKLVLRSHRGMPGHFIMARAAESVTGRSTRLRWTPSAWELVT